MSEPVSLHLHTETLAGQLEAACLLEAAARKPGNVHPGAKFIDLRFGDFVTSAAVVAPLLAQASKRGVGQSLLDCALATRKAVGKNTNLGILLLLAPLAAVPEGESLLSGLPRVLETLTDEDSRLAYKAIRAAQPGGMGDVAEQDLSTAPSLPLREIMQLAADRDSIARQYTNNFADVLGRGLASVSQWKQATTDWETLVQGLFLDLLHQIPDTLIARKVGIPMACEASTRAGEVLALGWPTSPAGQRAFAELDPWLRADGHQRNPGTTADLVAATLFAALRENRWQPPAQLMLNSKH